MNAAFAALYLPFVVPLVACAALMLGLAIFSWERRDVPGALAMVVIGVAVTVWSLAYAAEIVATDLPTKVAWARVEYPAISAIAPAWLAFALSFTGRGYWLTSRRLALVLAGPIVCVISEVVAGADALFWQRTYLGRSGPFPELVHVYSPLFWVYTAYTYLLILLGTAILVAAYRRSPPTYHSQAGALLVAVLAPWVANITYITGLTPVRHLDLTPFGFTISGVALSWAIFRRHFYEVFLGLPLVAEAIVLQHLRDGVVVVDSTGMIVSANAAAQSLLGAGTDDLIGCRADLVFPDWLAWLASLREAGVLQGELRVERSGRWRDLEVVASRGGMPGVVVIARDVTERRRISEQAEARQLERARLDGVLATTHEAADRLANALNAAQGFTELALARGDLSPETQALLHGARDGLREAITYVRRLQQTEWRVSRALSGAEPDEVVEVGGLTFGPEGAAETAT